MQSLGLCGVIRLLYQGEMPSLLKNRALASSFITLVQRLNYSLHFSFISWMATSHYVVLSTQK